MIHPFCSRPQELFWAIYRQSGRNSGVGSGPAEEFAADGPARRSPGAPRRSTTGKIVSRAGSSRGEIRELSHGQWNRIPPWQTAGLPSGVSSRDGSHAQRSRCSGMARLHRTVPARPTRRVRRETRPDGRFVSCPAEKRSGLRRNSHIFSGRSNGIRASDFMGQFHEGSRCHDRAAPRVVAPGR